VRSPEERTGAGLDQRKTSVVARVARENPTTATYVLVEWAHTNEQDHGSTITSLGSLLGEASYCRSGTTVSGRVERTDRPEEERLLDPFRTPRPSIDLSNLGVSRWTAFAVSVSAPAVRANIVRARPFVEIERVGATPGNPSGLFNADIRYGARWMWMMTFGAKLSAGMRHSRMGRYGAAMLPSTDGTHMHADPSHSMAHGDLMPAMAPGTSSAALTRTCSP
jgi:hypothetical protein